MTLINNSNYFYIILGIAVYLFLSYFEIIPSYDFYKQASILFPIFFSSFAFFVLKHFSLNNIIYNLLLYKKLIILIILIFILFIVIFRRKGNNNIIPSYKSTYHKFMSIVFKRAKTINSDKTEILMFLFKDNELNSFGFYGGADFKKEIDFKSIVLMSSNLSEFNYYKEISEQITNKKELYKIIGTVYQKLFNENNLTKDNKTTQNQSHLEYMMQYYDYNDTNGYSIVAIDKSLIYFYFDSIDNIKN